MIQQRWLHPIKCTIWCAMTTDKIIRLYFFEDGDENPVTVSGEHYRAMIRNFLQSNITNGPNLKFQQDGATAHTARETLQLLRECFEDKMISHDGNVNWSSCSSDLSSPDFFLWGYLKVMFFFLNKVQYQQELKNNIQNQETKPKSRNPPSCQ